MDAAGYTRRDNIPNPYSVTGRKGEGCMAMVCANSKRDDNQRLLLPIMTVGSIGREKQQVHKLETVGDIKKSRSR